MYLNWVIERNTEKRGITQHTYTLLNKKKKVIKKFININNVWNCRLGVDCRDKLRVGRWFVNFHLIDSSAH